MIETSEKDLAGLDRAVRRAAEATSAWHARLEGPAAAAARLDEAPLERHRTVASRSLFRELGERDLLQEEGPLRDALRRWVGSLTVLRVTEGERFAVVQAETAPTAEVRLESSVLTSFRAAWRGFVASQNHVEASAWLAAIVQRTADVRAARRQERLRAEEAVTRLGVETYDVLVQAVSPAAIRTAAEAFLRETRDLSRSLRRETERTGKEGIVANSFAGVVWDALARDAGDGWPAHLTPRTLVDTLGAPADFARGLRLQVTMPTAIAAASFARALEAFGTAYRKMAATTSTLPFALASDPYFVDAYRFGFAFGSLPASVAYERRGLGLAPRVATAQARSLTKTAFLHARAVALGALLSRAAAHPDAARFQELTHDVFGEGVPRELAGVFPRAAAANDAEARLQGLLTTLSFVRELRDTFDEDWFRNPQAWRFLRARASGPARPPEEPAADPKGLARAFEEALG